MTFKRLIKGKIHLYPLHTALSQSDMRTRVWEGLADATDSNRLDVAQIWDIAALLHKFLPGESEGPGNHHQGSDDEDDQEEKSKELSTPEAGIDESALPNGFASSKAAATKPSVCTSPLLAVSFSSDPSQHERNQLQ